MIKTIKSIWAFSEKRHDALLKSMGFSFLHSAVGVTQLLAVILTIRVLTGEMQAAAGAWMIAGLTLACVAGSFFAAYYEQTKAFEAGFMMTGDQRVKIADLLRRMPLGFFSEASSGRITALLTTTLSAVESGAILSLTTIISGLCNAVCLVICMLFYDKPSALIALAGMAVYMLVVSWQMKLSRRQAPALQKAQSALAENALTFLQGIKVTKAFSFKQGDRKLAEAIDGSCDANIDLTRKSMPSQYAASLTIAAFESIILLTALHALFIGQTITAAKAIVLMIFSFMAFASLNQAGSILSMIGLLDVGLSEVEKVKQEELLVCREPAEKPDENEIVLEDVSFAYGDNEVLHHVSTTIKEKELTAIIGPSGSGKTTMCRLIPRFADVSSGRITIGGADIRNMPYEELMKKISMVFQHVYLFEDTILENIRFGKPDATLEEVKAAARAARCDEFISALPDGYHTMVGEGGCSLSGGEKQRISIARAMLKDAPIIILDEATSALDAENEHEILAAIDELTRNKTVIMIAHRLASVRKADHIIAVEKGRIVQEGTDKTLRVQDGLYRDFLEAREKAADWRIAN